MRTNICVVILTIMLMAPGCTRSLPDTENEAADLVESLYRDSSFAEASDVADRAIEIFGASERLLAKKYKVLLGQERYADALETFEGIIMIAGDHPNIVIDKLRLQRRLRRYDAALETANAMYESYPDETPYICLEAARVGVETGSDGMAMDWLERSVDQGFDDYEYLLSGHFASLGERPRFDLLIDRMKRAAGIGLPVKDFTVPLFGGGSFGLPETRGQVVLLDFWATWCVPCVSEHPKLLDMYEGYRKDGFEIVSISADTDSAAVSRFVREHPTPWIVGYSGEGRKDPVIAQYGIGSFPTYIVIDREGIVQYVSSTGGDRLEQEIRKMMGRS